MKDYGLPLSAALHVLIIAGAIFAMPAATPFEPAVESMPVEIITPEQFQQIAQGEEQAKPDPTPKTKAEKVAPQKPVKTVEAPKVQPDATTPTPPTRAVPQQMAAAEPVEPPEPPPPPPKPAPEKPQAAKPAPIPPPEPPTPPEPAKPPEPVKQAEQTPPKPQPKPVPQEDAQKLEELALNAAEEPKPEPPKPEPPKPEPVKAKPVKKPEPPKPEVAKADPAKPVEKPVKTVDKADPKQLEKLLASLKTDAKAEAKPEAATSDSDKPAKPTPVKPVKPLDMGGLKDILNKHPSTVPAKVAAADSTDAPDALPSKEPPARAQKSGEKPTETASLGKQDAVAPKLSLSERNALVGAIREHVKACWNKPVASSDPKSLIVTVEFNLNADGTLSSAPVAHGGNVAAAGAAKRAVMMCVTAQKPLKLPPNLYASWKEIEVSFDPST